MTPPSPDGMMRSGDFDLSQRMLHFTTLGTIDLDGRPGCSTLVGQPKLLSVFAFLVLARREGYHQRQRIAGLFWPEQSDDKARASLRSALTALRTVLGDDVVLRRGDSDVGIDIALIQCDAFDFEDALDRGELALALELYRGPLLEGLFPDTVALQHWLDECRARYQERAAEAAWTLATRYESAHGDLTSAARWARRAAQLAGADERRVRRVLELLARAGDAAGAIAIYQEFVRYLKRALDLEPSRETVELAESIRRQR